MSDERRGDGEAEGPPPPSPLTGGYLLVLLPQLHSPLHKDRLLHALTKGLITWDAQECHVDLDKELQNITAQAPEGEEAKNGERLIQFASENLVTEVLIHPQLNTLVQCMRNCLSSFTRHRHIIHAGYTSAGNGAWVLQDGTYSFSDFADMYSEHEVQRVLRAYEGTVSVDVHCSGEGDWWALKAKDPFSKVSRVRLNPPDKGSTTTAVRDFLNYLSQYLVPAGLNDLLEPSDVVGNIRFSHPTLYVFPGGQGDAALFGINGFNMLVDGGFSRKACFWDFTRHLDRLDSVLMTRINNGNLQGLASLLKRKKSEQVYPQIGHFFSNIPDRKQVLSPDGDKDRDPLLINLIEQGQEMLSGLRHLGLKPQACYREPSVEPINLYHKVGHGKLDMYVLSPAKDSREVREFLAKWAAVDSKIFCSYSRKGEFNFPLSSKTSICALLVWQPANPEDNITRLLFPGSTPQQKIFEGLDRLKNLEFMKHPICSAKSLSPTSSTIKLSIKSTPKPAIIEKVAEIEKKQSETVKAVKQVAEVKKSTPAPPKPKPKADRPKEKPKTDLDSKPETVKIDRKTTEAVQKVEKEIKKEKPKRAMQKPQEKKTQKPPEKKTDSVKSSPTTPKKTVENKLTEMATTRTEIKTRASRAKASPTSTPAKSAKEENNRKVVELKSRESTKLQKAPPTKREESKKIEKSVGKKPTASPKGVKSLSPIKAAKPSAKQRLDVKKTSKTEKDIITDSSAVSTPSTVDAELTKAKEEAEKTKEISESKPEDASRKASEDIGKSISKEDDDEILIIEKLEISDEVTGKADVEKIALHLQKLDEEKKKIPKEQQAGAIEEKETADTVSQEKTVGDTIPSPETKQVAQEEVQDIIETATEIVTKRLDIQKTDSQEISGKDLGSTDKIVTPKEKDMKSADVEQRIDESQPDEKFSTTVESGATTTAPTLPEDERIPLDEIKEGIEEKLAKEETKEKEVIAAPRPEQPTSLPQVPVIAGTVFDQRAQLLKDIVKTPDEVADLPVHEEVDAGIYEGAGKDELLSLPPTKKEKKDDTTEELKLFKDNLEKEDKSKDLKEDMVESVDVLSHTTTDLDMISSSQKSGKPLESEEKEEIQEDEKLEYEKESGQEKIPGPGETEKQEKEVKTSREDKQLLDKPEESKEITEKETIESKEKEEIKAPLVAKLPLEEIARPSSTQEIEETEKDEGVCLDETTPQLESKESIPTEEKEDEIAKEGKGENRLEDEHKKEFSLDIQSKDSDKTTEIKEVDKKLLSEKEVEKLELETVQEAQKELTKVVAEKRTGEISETKELIEKDIQEVKEDRKKSIEDQKEKVESELTIDSELEKKDEILKEIPKDEKETKPAELEKVQDSETEKAEPSKMAEITLFKEQKEEEKELQEPKQTSKQDTSGVEQEKSKDIFEEEILKETLTIKEKTLASEIEESEIIKETESKEVILKEISDKAKLDESATEATKASQETLLLNGKLTEDQGKLEQISVTEKELEDIIPEELKKTITDKKETISQEEIKKADEQESQDLTKIESEPSKGEIKQPKEIEGAEDKKEIKTIDKDKTVSETEAKEEELPVDVSGKIKSEIEESIKAEIQETVEDIHVQKVVAEEIATEVKEDAKLIAEVEKIETKTESTETITKSIADTLVDQKHLTETKLSDDLEKIHLEESVLVNGLIKEEMALSDNVSDSLTSDYEVEQVTEDTMFKKEKGELESVTKELSVIGFEAEDTGADQTKKLTSSTVIDKDIKAEIQAMDLTAETKLSEDMLKLGEKLPACEDLKDEIKQAGLKSKDETITIDDKKDTEIKPIKEEKESEIVKIEEKKKPESKQTEEKKETEIKTVEEIKEAIIPHAEKIETEIKSSDKITEFETKPSSEKKESELKPAEQKEAEIKPLKEEADSEIKSTEKKTEAETEPIEEMKEAEVKLIEEMKETEIKTIDEKTEIVTSTEEKKGTEIKSIKEKIEVETKSSEEKKETELKPTEELQYSAIKDIDEKDEVKIQSTKELNEPEITKVKEKNETDTKLIEEKKDDELKPTEAQKEDELKPTEAQKESEIKKVDENEQAEIKPTEEKREFETKPSEEIKEDGIKLTEEKKEAEIKLMEEQKESDVKKLEEKKEAEIIPKEETKEAEIKKIEDKTETEKKSVEEKKEDDIKKLEERKEEEIQPEEEKKAAEIKTIEEKTEIESKIPEEKKEAEIKSTEEQKESEIKIMEQKVDTEMKTTEEKKEDDIKPVEEKKESEIKPSEERKKSEVKKIDEKVEAETKPIKEQKDSEIKQVEEKAGSDIKTSEEKKEDDLKSIQEQKEFKTKPKESEITSTEKKTDAELKPTDEKKEAETKPPEEKKVTEVKATDEEKEVEKVLSKEKEDEDMKSVEEMKHIEAKKIDEMVEAEIKSTEEKKEEEKKDSEIKATEEKKETKIKSTDEKKEAEIKPTAEIDDKKDFGSKQTEIKLKDVESIDVIKLDEQKKEDLIKATEEKLDEFVKPPEKVDGADIKTEEDKKVKEMKQDDRMKDTEIKLTEQKKEVEIEEEKSQVDKKLSELEIKQSEETKEEKEVTAEESKLAITKDEGEKEADTKLTEQTIKGIEIEKHEVTKPLEEKGDDICTKPLISSLHEKEDLKIAESEEGAIVKQTEKKDLSTVEEKVKETDVLSIEKEDEIKLDKEKKETELEVGQEKTSIDVKSLEQAKEGELKSGLEEDYKIDASKIDGIADEMNELKSTPSKEEEDADSIDVKEIKKVEVKTDAEHKDKIEMTDEKADTELKSDGDKKETQITLAEEKQERELILDEENKEIELRSVEEKDDTELKITTEKKEAEIKTDARTIGNEMKSIEGKKETDIKITEEKKETDIKVTEENKKDEQKPTEAQKESEIKKVEEKKEADIKPTEDKKEFETKLSEEKKEDEIKTNEEQKESAIKKHEEKKEAQIIPAEEKKEAEGETIVVKTEIETKPSEDEKEAEIKPTEKQKESEIKQIEKKLDTEMKTTEEKKEDDIKPVEEKKDDKRSVEEKKEDDIKSVEEKKDDIISVEEKKEDDIKSVEETKESEIKPSEEQKKSEVKKIDEKVEAEIKPTKEQKDSEIKQVEEKADSDIKTSGEKKEDDLKSIQEQKELETKPKESEITSTEKKTDTELKPTDEKKEAEIKSIDEKTEFEAKLPEEKKETEVKPTDEKKEVEIKTVGEKKEIEEKPTDEKKEDGIIPVGEQKEPEVKEEQGKKETGIEKIEVKTTDQEKEIKTDQEKDEFEIKTIEEKGVSAIKKDSFKEHFEQKLTEEIIMSESKSADEKQDIDEKKEYTDKTEVLSAGQETKDTVVKPTDDDKVTEAQLVTKSTLLKAEAEGSSQEVTDGPLEKKEDMSSTSAQIIPIKKDELAEEMLHTTPGDKKAESVHEVQKIDVHTELKIVEESKTTDLKTGSIEEILKLEKGPREEKKETEMKSVEEKVESGITLLKENTSLLTDSSFREVKSTKVIAGEEKREFSGSLEAGVALGEQIVMNGQKEIDGKPTEIIEKPMSLKAECMETISVKSETKLETNLIKETDPSGLVQQKEEFKLISSEERRKSESGSLDKIKELDIKSTEGVKLVEMTKSTEGIESTLKEGKLEFELKTTKGKDKSEIKSVSEVKEDIEPPEYAKGLEIKLTNGKKEVETKPSKESSDTEIKATDKEDSTVKATQEKEKPITGLSGDKETTEVKTDDEKKDIKEISIIEKEMELSQKLMEIGTEKSSKHKEDFEFLEESIEKHTVEKKGLFEPENILGETSKIVETVKKDYESAEAFVMESSGATMSEKMESATSKSTEQGTKDIELSKSVTIEKEKISPEGFKESLASSAFSVENGYHHEGVLEEFKESKKSEIAMKSERSVDTKTKVQSSEISETVFTDLEKKLSETTFEIHSKETIIHSKITGDKVEVLSSESKDTASKIEKLDEKRADFTEKIGKITSAEKTDIIESSSSSSSTIITEESGLSLPKPADLPKVEKGALDSSIKEEKTEKIKDETILTKQPDDIKESTSQKEEISTASFIKEIEITTSKEELPMIGQKTKEGQDSKVNGFTESKIVSEYEGAASVYKTEERISETTFSKCSDISGTGPVQKEMVVQEITDLPSSVKVEKDTANADLKSKMQDEKQVDISDISADPVCLIPGKEPSTDKKIGEMTEVCSLKYTNGEKLRSEQHLTSSSETSQLSEKHDETHLEKTTAFEDKTFTIGKVESTKDITTSTSEVETFESSEVDGFTTTTTITTTITTTKTVPKEVEGTDISKNGAQKKEETITTTETKYSVETDKPKSIALTEVSSTSLTEGVTDKSEQVCKVEKIVTEKHEIESVKDVSVIKSKLISEVTPALNGSIKYDSDGKTSTTTMTKTETILNGSFSEPKKTLQQSTTEGKSISSEIKDSIKLASSAVGTEQTIKAEKSKISLELEKKLGTTNQEKITESVKEISEASSSHLSTESKQDTLKDISMIKDMTASFISTERWTDRRTDPPEGRATPSTEATWRESDDDLPPSPLSTTSHLHSPPPAMYSSMYVQDDDSDISFGKPDIDFETAAREHAQTRGETLPKDPIEKWGKPLGLPPPPSGKDYWSPFKEWGRPLHLPSPAPAPAENDTEDTSGSAKTTPKKVAKMNEENNRYASNIVIGKEANNKNRRSDSPVKRNMKDGKKAGMGHIYLDLSYVPHHGNSHYANVEFFKRVRARYYVFSGTEPSKDVFNALLEAKQQWEDKDLEVTIIPTYDTDTLGYWIAENEETLSKYKIDLSPSASRCTINLQDHDTSCSAYRLEF